MKDDILYIIHEFDHWDMPITGLGYYNNQLVWFDMSDEFDCDPVTKQPLDDEQFNQRLAVTRRLENDFKCALNNGNHQLGDHIAEQLDLIEPQTTQVYKVYRLSLFDKLCLLFRMYKFHLFVGTHWTYNQDGYRRRPFKMNRWLGLGRLLFRLYYHKDNAKDLDHCKREKEKYRTRPVIGEVRLDQDVQFGKPQRNKHA